ncbi:MAG: methionine ABC transporter ATP-binding protein [Methylophaga sp.]|nr:MAG: methionine ABC transporter ATP-binding protein [Methylophaga sp.]
MTAAVIQFSNVRFRYSEQGQDVLDITDLQVHQGEHLFIQGASGSGKTTLLNIMTGINQPYAGKIQVLGKALQNLSAIESDRFRVDNLGIIFQQFNLLPYLSLLENVQLPCWFSAKRRAQAGNSKQAAAELLQQLHIPKSMFDKPVNALSMGQQQRVAVARALIGKPEIIIADEPTSALDSDNRKRFLDLLFSQTDKQNSTLVFVSHDSQIAPYFSRTIDLSEINSAIDTEYNA